MPWLPSEKSLQEFLVTFNEALFLVDDNGKAKNKRARTKGNWDGRAIYGPIAFATSSVVFGQVTHTGVCYSGRLTQAPLTLQQPVQLQQQQQQPPQPPPARWPPQRSKARSHLLHSLLFWPELHHACTFPAAREYLISFYQSDSSFYHFVNLTGKMKFILPVRSADL